MNSATLPIDYLGFTAIALTVFIALHIWLRRRGGKRGIPVVGWLTVLIIIGGGALLAERMGSRAGERVTHALLGFAPTYAVDLERMGHAEVSRDTSPNDPRYLEMITAEKRWLAANPVVNDIYTMRESSPGKRYFVVDSETDYDHNGRYEGEREARTAIGEPFDIDEPALTRAFGGHGAINAVPTTDRWGTWVSAYWPLHASNGRVEAIVGVDYDAAAWVREIQRARYSAMILTALLLLTVFAATVLIFLQSTELEARSAAAEALRSARDAAESASALKSQFLACMSHEIRTPLNGVMGVTELLLGTELAAKQRHYADLIYRSASTLLNVINDILDYSKIEADKLVIEDIEFDPVELIEDVGELFASRAQSKGVELNVEIPTSSPRRLRGDPNRIRQVLNNLVSNAIKFTERGEVTVCATWNTNQVAQLTMHCDVRDTGPGVDTGMQSQLFEPFIQADGSITRRFGGTGLGLAICKRLTELMHGRIGHIRDINGTNFWFEVPLVTVSQSALIPPAMSSDGLRGRRALIVDDNGTNREILEQVLTAWGLRHVSVSNARDGLRLLEQAVSRADPFDVVISDRDMPEIDGLEFCRQIRQQPNLSATRLLMLSSVSDDDHQANWRELGIEHYLTKPVRQSALFRAMILSLANPSECESSLGAAPTSPDSHDLTRFGANILLAEDNTVNQLITQEMLRGLGCTVDTVNDGHEACAAAIHPERRYAAILIDCEMPGLDGLKATQRIRAFEAQHLTRSRVPIIAVTGHAQESHREACLAAGMNDYLSKPFTTDQLAVMLRHWLSAKPSIDVRRDAA